MLYIGIDPGKHGALAVLNSDGTVRLLQPFDEYGYSVALATLNDAVVCALEKVGAMPGQGVTSMFTFGDNFGFIRGLLAAYEIPYQLVPPVKWKKAFSVTADKGSSIAAAQRLFPHESLLRTERSRKPDDNIAEALLLAEYARRNFSPLDGGANCPF